MPLSDVLGAVRQTQGALTAVKGQNPDDAAQAQQQGVDPGVFQYSRDNAPDAAPIVQQTPKTASYLSDPKNAAVSQDDIPALQGFETFDKAHAQDSQAHQTVINGFQPQDFWTREGFQGPPKFPEWMRGLGYAFVGQGIGDAVNAEANAIPVAANALEGIGFPGMEAIQKWYANSPDKRVAAYMQSAGSSDPEYMARQAETVATAYKSGLPNAVGKAVEVAAQGVSGIIGQLIPAMLLGGPYAMGFLAVGTGVNAAAEAKEKGLGPNEATWNGVEKGALLYAVSKPIQELQGLLEGKIGAGPTKQILGAALTQRIKQVAVGMYHGAFSFAALTGGNALADYSTGEKDAFKDIGPRLLDSIASGSLLGALPETAGLAKEAVSTAGDVVHEMASKVQAASDARRWMIGLRAWYDLSKTAKRAPEAMSRFVDSQVQGTPREFWHVKPDDFTDVAAEAGLSPLDFAAHVKAVSSFLASKREGGTDIQIPVSGLLTGTDKATLDKLQEKGRLDPGGLNSEEAAIEGKRAAQRGRPVKEPVPEASLGETLLGTAKRIMTTGKAKPEPPLDEHVQAIQMAHQELGRFAWMDPGDNKEHAQLIYKAREAAHQTLVDAHLKRIEARETQGWKEAYGKVVEKLEPVIGDRRYNKAREALSGDVKLDGKQFRKLGLTSVPGAPGAFAENGMGPWEAATAFGYSSPREMINELKSSPLKADEIKDNATWITDAGYGNRAKEPMLDEAIRAAHGTEDTKVLKFEAFTLMKKYPELKAKLLEKFNKSKDAAFRRGVRGLGIVSQTDDETNAEIDRDMASRPMKEFNPKLYLKMESDARKSQASKYAAGDVEGAAIAKGKEIWAHEAVKRSLKMKDALESMGQDLTRLARTKNLDKVDQEYRDQMENALAAHKLGKPSANAGPSLPDFLDSHLAAQDGRNEIEVPASTFATFRMNQPVSLRDVPVGDFVKFHSMMKALDKAGKDARNLIVDGKRKELTLAVMEATLVTKDRGPLKIISGIGKGEAKVGISHLRAETVLDALDDHKPAGPWNAHVMERWNAASRDETNLNEEIFSRAKGVLKSFTKEELEGDYELPLGLRNVAKGESSISFRRFMGLLGYRGDDEAFQKLSEGFGVSRGALSAWIDSRATNKNWADIQKFAAAFEGLGERKQEMLWRTGQRQMKRVSKVEFQTATAGKLPGWYWPITHDPDLIEHDKRALFDNRYASYNNMDTATGRDITRQKNAAAPMLFDLDQFHKVVRTEVHDITHNEAVRDVNKFLQHPTIKAEVTRMVGKPFWDQLNETNRRVANSGFRGLQELGSGGEFARGLRRNATVASLGFNAIIGALHLRSIGLQGIVELGNPKWFAAGQMKRFDPEMQRVMAEESAEMPKLMSGKGEDRDFQDALDDLETKMMNPALSMGKRFYYSNQANAFWLYNKLSNITMRTEWAGAYLKGVASKEDQGEGLQHKEAVQFADKIIRNAHGGSGVKDLALFQSSDNEWWKLCSMYSGYWNHVLNRTVSLMTQGGKSATWHSASRLAQIAAGLAVYTLLSPELHRLAERPKDKVPSNPVSRVLDDQFDTAMTADPITSGVNYAFEHPWHGNAEYSMSPVESIPNGFFKAWHDVHFRTTAAKDAVSEMAEGRPLEAGKYALDSFQHSRYLLKDLAKGPGAAFGLGGSSTISDIPDALQAVRRYYRQPPTPMDLGIGVLTGEIPKK